MDQPGTRASVLAAATDGPYEGIVTAFSFEGTSRPINAELWSAQESLIRTFLRDGSTQWQIAGPFTHTQHVDRVTSQFRSMVDALRQKGRQVELDGLLQTVIILFDIDCVPISSKALPTLVAHAQRGALIGNVQRSNHLDNGSHLYAAPSCLALTVGTFERLGWPSAAMSKRSDVCEEWTWIAEERGIDVVLLKPLRYEYLPYRASVPYRLTPELGDYGIGTTFGTDDGTPLTWHCFEFSRPAEPIAIWARRAASAIKHRRDEPLGRGQAFDRSGYVVRRMREFEKQATHAGM